MDRLCQTLIIEHDFEEALTLCTPQEAENKDDLGRREVERLPSARGEVKPIYKAAREQQPAAERGKGSDAFDAVSANSS